MTEPQQPTLDLPCAPASVKQHGAGIFRVALGITAALIATALTASLACWLFELTRIYIQSYGSWCGYDRVRVKQAMTFPIPLILIVQLVCVAITCYSKNGLVVARSAAAISITYYVACNLIIANLYGLLSFMNGP